MQWPKSAQRKKYLLGKKNEAKRMFLLQVSNMQDTKKKHSDMSADNPERSTENLFFRLIRSDAEYQAVLFEATGVFNKKK